MSGRADAEPYTPGHGDLSYDVTRYDLDLTYKVEGNHLTGRALLDCVANERLDSLRLDLHRLHVSKVTVDGVAVKHTHTRGTLRVRLRREVDAGEDFVVAVHYSGQPRPLSNRKLGQAGWEELTDGSIVAAQPHGAPTWFPTNDRPSNKAVYRMTITAPNAYQVVANGTLLTSTRHSSMTSWVYDQPEPMAPYLATVHVGRYEIRDLEAVVPLRAVVPRSRSAAFDEAFGAQPQMLEVFTRLFGDYPFDGYTVVVTDDDLEIPLESQSLSTFGANHLLDEWDVERLIAHELAHQWFGNSVTLTAWRDIWLHEGFACYAEWIWSEETGRDSADVWARHHWARLAVLEVLAFGRKSGLSLQMMADHLSDSEARCQITDRMLPALLQGKASTDFALALMLKDIYQALSLGMKHDTPMPITAIAQGLLMIGASLQGPRARLEDMVSIIGAMAGSTIAADLVKSDAAHAETGETYTPDFIPGIVASQSRAISYECISAGLNYGLQLKDMSEVLHASSGWSNASRNIFRELMGGEHPSNSSVDDALRHLQEGCSFGSRIGAPLMIANETRTLFERMRNEYGSGKGVHELSRLYPATAR